MKASLVRHEKFIVGGRFIVEIVVHSISDRHRYPAGFKYALVCVDRKTGRRVLLDNHHPKGPHVHLGDEELAYEYVDLDQLVTDFRKFVSEYLGANI